MKRKSIPELMAITQDERDLLWLTDSLQTAIQLELSTLPLYLTPLWSIKDSGTVAGKLISGIMLQEMKHMGLACNMLTTIGGFPEIDDPEIVPTYPGNLPGDVNPELTVHLQKLTTGAAAEYMEVELPDFTPVAIFEGVSYPTIGAFYTAIQEEFNKLSPSDFTGENQQSITFYSAGVGEVFPINNLEDATKAITTIKEEGEGTSTSPFEDGEATGELSHYYKFGQIHYGKMLEPKTGGGWAYTGDPVPMPDTYDMRIDPGTHPDDADESADFDKAYTKVLKSLHGAWQPGGSFSSSPMYNLQAPAQALMQKEIPGGNGKTYGPCWQYVAED